MSDTNDTPITPPGQQDNPWANIGADPDLARDGIWVDDFLAPGFRVRVRSMNAAIVKKSLDKMFMQRRSVISANSGMVPTEMRDRMDAELCRVLVVDWDGITDPDNPRAQMPCTPDNIMRIATHPQFGPAFRAEVHMIANQQSFFRAAALEEIAKN